MELRSRRYLTGRATHSHSGTLSRPDSPPTCPEPIYLPITVPQRHRAYFQSVSQTCPLPTPSLSSWLSGPSYGCQGVRLPRRIHCRVGLSALTTNTKHDRQVSSSRKTVKTPRQELPSDYIPAGIRTTIGCQTFLFSKT
jgi:hypothetical protein